MAPLSRGILIVLVAVNIARNINTNGESLEKYRYCSRPCVTGSAPKTCSYEFFVSELPNLNSVCHASTGNDTDLRPDCPEEFFGNGVLGINGKTPGPQIEICLGDTLEVILKNGLGTAEVSLHWHGIRQKGSAHMDGVPMVSQCPLLPFSSFRYEMKPESSGSYLYYAQSAPQQGDGLYGVLIVRDAESDPKSEKTLLLSASLQAPLTQLWSEVITPTDLLVNGKKNGYRLIVNENRRYLMRLINANAIACPVVLSIAAHELLVVAVDGQKVERPASASHVVLFPDRGMEWTRDKTLELLHAYQQRRVLWDWSARGYRDRTKRRRAIQELAEILNCNTLEIEKKITNLKCQYSREVHKIQNSRDVATGPEDIYVSKWFAFKAMQFLQFGTRRYSKRKKKVDQLKLEEEEYIVSDIDPESIAFHDCSDGTNGSASGSIINASLSEDAEESFSSSMKMEERFGSVTLKRDERSLGRDEDGDPEEIKVEVDTGADHNRRKSERFDLTLETNQTPGRYSINIQGMGDCRDLVHAASMDYEKSSKATTITESGFRLSKKDIVSLEKGHNCHEVSKNIICSLDTNGSMDKSVKQYPDETFYVSFDLNTVDNVDDGMSDFNYNIYGFTHYPSFLSISESEVRVAQINGITFQYPPSPILSQPENVPDEILCSIEEKSEFCNQNTPRFCECLQILELPVNKTIELVIIDEGFGGNSSHTFHVHGYQVSVVGFDSLKKPTTKAEINILDLDKALPRNLLNPPKKDTFTVPNKGYAIVRFVSDNLGYWLWEVRSTGTSAMKSGPGMQFLVQVGSRENMPTVPIDFPSCGNNKKPDMIFENN